MENLRNITDQDLQGSPVRRKTKTETHLPFSKDDQTTGSISLLTMSALANLPPPSWLIPSLIPDHGLGFLIGKPAAGKSFFLLELAQAVCQEVAVLGDESLVPTRTGWVLALLPEASASWATRIRAYCSYHDLEYSSNFVCCLEQNNLTDDETWTKVITTLDRESDRRGELPTLVIIDTLSASIPGQDENSQAAMTPLISNLQELVTKGCCVIVAHHPTKYSNNYRGSTVLLGACDWMVSIIQTKNVREFRADKLRDAEGIESTSFTIRPHGESAICIGLNEPGPWAAFNSATLDHPGLADAMRIHGFSIPDELPNIATGTDIVSTGVSLKEIQASWNRIKPINPSNQKNTAAYKSIHGKRVTALLILVESLIRGNILETISGNFSRKKRGLTVIVRQVIQNED